MSKRIVIFYFLVFWSVISSAQQEMRFTQYMFNLYQVNSAYAGSREAISLAAIVRTQWTGIDGSPTMQSITATAPILSKNIGLGFKAINQSTGASDQTRIMATFVYHLRLGNGKLAFGGSAGLLNNRFNWGKAQFKDQIDQVQTSGIENSYSAALDFALYFYMPTWYVGIQFENLNQSEYETIKGGTSINHLNYTIIAGKAFPLNNNIVFKPSLLLRGTKGSFIGELNLSLLFNEVFWVGITYRSVTELSLIFEYNLKQKLRIGYSFDYSINSIQSRYAGSHELFLGFDIQVKNKNMVSPRYF